MNIYEVDLEEMLKEKYPGHWAERLQNGDRCLGTIRFSNGDKNIINAKIIVIENDVFSKKITGVIELPTDSIDEFTRDIYAIPYNELSERV